MLNTNSFIFIKEILWGKLMMIEFISSMEWTNVFIAKSHTFLWPQHTPFHVLKKLGDQKKIDTFEYFRLLCDFSLINDDIIASFIIFSTLTVLIIIFCFMILFHSLIAEFLTSSVTKKLWNFKSEKKMDFFFSMNKFVA